MTEQQVREIVRDELSQKNPFRGGWLTAETPMHRTKVRRWRDPKTGIVYHNGAGLHSAARFEDYTNVQWEDGEPVRQEYPPAGLPMMVKWSETDFWFIALSCGNGKFLMGPSLNQEKPADWRYIPANWGNAPEWAEQWVVASTGEQDWVSRRYKVGDQYYDGCTVIHVEHRPTNDYRRTQ